MGADGSVEGCAVERARLTLPAPRGPAPSVQATKANVAKITQGMARWFCMGSSETGWTTRITPEKAEPVVATCAGPAGVYDADPMAQAATVPSGAAEQRSLASRMRGWKDDASGLEQRLKDLETIARSLRQRWPTSERATCMMSCTAPPPAG